MSDRSKNEDEVPKSDDSTDKILKSPFWKTLPGRLLVLVGVGHVITWILPTDKLLEQAAKPGVTAAGKAVHLAADKLVVEPLQYVWRYTLGIAVAGLILLVPIIGLALMGIWGCHGYLVGIAGLIGTGYLYFCWLNLRTVGKTLAEFVDSGADLAQTAVGKILNVVGLNPEKRGNKTSLTKTVDDLVLIGRYVIATTLLATPVLIAVTALAKTPPWISVGLLFIGAVAFLAAVSISTIQELEIPFKPTWVRNHKAVKWFGLAMIAAGLLVAFLPNLWPGAVNGRNAANDWVANPTLGSWWRWVVVALPLIGAAAAAIMSAYYGGKKEAGKQSAWRMAGGISVLSALAIAIVMGATGSLTWPMIERSWDRFRSGTETAADSSGERLTPIPAPAPKPDYAGVSDEDLLKGL